MWQDLILAVEISLIPIKNLTRYQSSLSPQVAAAWQVPLSAYDLVELQERCL